jgi:hypothetical protein
VQKSARQDKCKAQSDGEDEILHTQAEAEMNGDDQQGKQELPQVRKKHLPQRDAGQR